MPERGTSVNGGNRPPRGNGEGVAQASSLPNTCSVYRATHILFKWLNRKSQRKAYNWDQFNQALKSVGWPRARIRKDLNPFRSAEAC
uniref:Uncharacterized protein n=1 Tax=Candidatus Kentrum sp. LPFa TaxID=2126335 RepID=A0A450X732_9GAMM|nr:MAG: hypothetical protein BECKLPF1236B_GA0070989_14051 [Candidatus Kentron sp. LPFa]VFK25119.1 MAG: hypothetical protein BECKLPF1236B_GA0070989_14571 [Candidatus Kentron sp. LPFa]